jgi:serine O-acetyltransferase
MFNPIIYYRIARRLFLWNVPVLPKIITYFIRLVFSCYLPYTAKLGRDSVLGYGGLGIVIHGRTVIGDGCHIDQNVTIGGTSKKHKVPVLGNNVYVGAGAKILGPIKIGNEVVIGANAVVLTDIPNNSVAVGIPAKVIKSGILKSDYV